LGLADRVVGVTFECDFPPAARSTATVVLGALDHAGSTPAEVDAAVRAALAAGVDLYRLDLDALRALDPDLVLTQDLCRVCAVPTGAVDAALDRLGCPAQVLTLDPHTLDEVLGSVVAVGEAAGAEIAASALVAQLGSRLAALSRSVAGRPRQRVALLEWSDPPFAAGHWVPELVRAAGGDEVLGVSGRPSREVTWAAVAGASPDVVVVAPCGFDLPAACAAAAEVLPRLPPGVAVWAVDGSAYVARPGPRLVEGAEALAWALHPDAVPVPPPGRVARVR
jgi:iron complex transport system substrate-binding protein